MSATLRALAEDLGVSTATVSNALSGKGRVSAPLAQRIRARADAMGYAPSVPGRALRTGRSGVIGLLLPDLSHPLFPRIGRAVEAAAAEAGYGVLIADSRGSAPAQTAALLRLRRLGADGVIAAPVKGTRFAAPDGPLAVIDTPSTPGNTVSADHWGGGALAVARLIALGHRRIALLGEARASNVQRDRIGGMRSALSGGAQAREIWLEDDPAPDLATLARAGLTAVAATSDLHALTALGLLMRAGIAAPDAVSVIGFDDLAFGAAMHPALSTVAPDMDGIARVAVAEVIAQIEGAAPAEHPPAPMRLIERASTGPAPTRTAPDPRQEIA